MRTRNMFSVALALLVLVQLAACQGEHAEAAGFLFFTDELRHFEGDLVGPFFGGFIDVRGDLLQTGEHGTLEGVLRTVVPGRYAVERNLGA